jgi:heparanase 1
MKKLKNILFVLFFVTKILFSYGQEKSQTLINLKQMQKIGSVDERYQSFNVEMCEVVGGDFWIPYELLDSVKKSSVKKKGFAALKWKIDPINLYEKKIRYLAKAIGPTYVRVSGTWANAVYFQNNDEPALANPPKGFNNVLTRKQWKGVIDFCAAVDGKLITSFPISDGMFDDKGNWKSDQVKSILSYTKQIGGEIFGAEMFNEPSHASHGNTPKGYNGDNYVKDFAAYKAFVSKEAPNMKILGPGSTGEGGILPDGLDIPVDKILAPSPQPKFDIFTYHYYGTVSKRCFGGQDEEKAMSNEWLSKTEKGFDFYEKVRNTYMPGTPIWLTETAETACGGNPLASTYTDSFRYLEQLGRLAKKGVQVVMHNTLARSEYALLDHDTHNPRPNYWSALLWHKFMGTEVYEAGSLAPGVDMFAHNLKGKANGRTLLIVNAKDSSTSVNIPSEGRLYLLTADVLFTKKIKLNGEDLALTSDGMLPAIKGKKVKNGGLKLPPYSIAFITFDKIK